MPIEFSGWENSKTIWEAKQTDYPNEAMLQALENGNYYLVVNDDEDARHIIISREKALELMRALEGVVIEQSSLF